MATRLFVGNLAFSVTREELEGLFKAAGFEVTATIPLDRQTGRPRGFGFVSFRTEQEAEDALAELDGARVGDRPLRLQWAREAEERRGSGGRRTWQDTSAGTSDSQSSGDTSDDDQEDSDDYVERHRSRPRRGSKHGSDRLRGRGMKRRIE